MLCAIIIRELVTRNSEYFMYQHLSEQTRSTLISDLLSSLQQEETTTVVNKISEALSALSNELFDDYVPTPYHEPSSNSHILK
ncbi:hypothetical protein A2U01_0059311, partial [Trifolium medium]|nr:hypothetical protein [Trifolium medium]